MPSTLVVTTTNNPAVLAAALVGVGCTLTGTPVYSGDPLAAGTYTGGDVARTLAPSSSYADQSPYQGGRLVDGSSGSGPLPLLASGLILSNGKAADAMGPNLTDSISTDFGPEGVEGDTATLTFQLIPDHATLRIEIAWGSDEYTEHIAPEGEDGFNDYMHIKVNGTHIAVVPDTLTPINCGTVYPPEIDGVGRNVAHFLESQNGDPAGDFQYDGFGLFGFTVPVTPGATYTIEIQVADTGPSGGFLRPGAVDSGVFLGVITSPSPVVVTVGCGVIALTGRVAGPSAVARFENATTVTGLTWIIVTLHSGVQYVWSDRPLPDPSTYYLGWKESRVIKWGRIRRSLSNIRDGQYETTDFTVTLDDNNHVVRNLMNDLVNASVAVYMIPDEARRRLEIPATVYRGVIREAKPTGVLQYDLAIKDPFAELFGAKGTMNLIPRRTVPRLDFANCAQPLVSSSAEGYVVDGTLTGGGSPEINVVFVRAGWGCFASGDKITIGSESFLVTASSMFNDLTYESGSPGNPKPGGPNATGGDAETWVAIDPPVAGTLTDGTAIVQSPMHKIEPSADKRVPFPYGFITDLHFTGGEDDGDGQGIPLYVGDKVLSDGRTYGEFIWAGWACYSPAGRPIAMVYFWNNPLPYGSFFTIGSLAVEAGVGGRICCPGYDNWAANGFTTSYVDYNGRRYTVLFLRGVFRDWALGLTEAPVNLGGVPFSVNAYGAASAGDGTGTLISNLAQQYKHAVTNLCPPKGEGYQTGPWLASPTFPDDPALPMIDAGSFDRADAQSALYVSGGFRGDFIVGANNEAISARDLIARFNLSGAWQCGFNNKTQFFIDLVNTDLATIPLGTSLGWVRDIFTSTFSITPLTKDLYTAIKYVHTQDYCGRADWRSKTADVADSETENAGATLFFGAKTTFETLSLYMLRGKNTDHDADDYVRGSQTIAVVLRLTLARLSNIQHLPALQTGPAGFEYELSDTIPITHFEGYGEGGWVEEPVRVERTEIDPSEYVTVIEGYQIAPITNLD